MSKLSPSLKSLINAPSARPGPVAPRSNMRTVFQRIAADAASKQVGQPGWLAVATGTVMTLNSPESLHELYDVAAPPSSSDKDGAVRTAEFMREIGLKCIGFNGVPRTINMLNAFRDRLPSDVLSALSKESTRTPTPTNINAINDRGFALWKSIYDPFDSKLYAKLSLSHPDLPVHILHSEYGALFADPEETARVPGRKVGRVLTSVLAVACLRAQTGVGPQVLSHVYGLRKAFEDGSAEGEEVVEGGRWLAGDEGSEWILERVDEIVKAVGGEEGGSFAPVRGKL